MPDLSPEGEKPSAFNGAKCVLLAICIGLVLLIVGHIVYDAVRSALYLDIPE